MFSGYLSGLDCCVTVFVDIHHGISFIVTFYAMFRRSLDEPVESGRKTGVPIETTVQPKINKKSNKC